MSMFNRNVWMEQRYNFPNNLYIKCNNNKYSPLSIIEHTKFLGDKGSYIHLAIRKYLQVLNGKICIDNTTSIKSSVTQNKNQEKNSIVILVVLIPVGGKYWTQAA